MSGSQPHRPMDGIPTADGSAESSAPEVSAAPSEGTAWEPLRVPIFRTLWLAALVSNIGTWMQNVAAVWYMTSLTSSPLMVALVQAATSLPVFLVGLPAGAIADILDRRRVLLWTQGWMLAVAGLLALLTYADVMNAWLLLALTFALGLGMAMNAPSWQAITPELVPRTFLTGAIALNSLTVNIGRAIGPALGGLIVAASGPALVFALNAVSFVAVLGVVYRWRRTPTTSILPAERMFAATRAGLRYAVHAPALTAVLLRSGLFMLCASAFWALLPIIARESLGAGAIGYGILLGWVGVGATAGAVILPRLRRRFNLDVLTALATTAFAIVSGLTAYWRWLPGVSLVMVIGGLAWIAMMASLNGAAQTTVPSWVRARALGVYLVVFQGAMGVGSAIWGALAERTGTPAALAISGAALLIGLAAIPRWPLSPGTGLDLTPAAHWPDPNVGVVPHDAGPVHVQVEYRIDPEQARAFSTAIRDLGEVRRRDGAIAWTVYQDPTTAGRYVEMFVVESWVEHLRQHERITQADRAIENRVRSFQQAGVPPVVTHLIANGQISQWRGGRDALHQGVSQPGCHPTKDD